MDALSPEPLLTNPSDRKSLLGEAGLDGIAGDDGDLRMSWENK